MGRGAPASQDRQDAGESAGRVLLRSPRSTRWQRGYSGAHSRDDADVTWWVEWCQVQIEHLILLYWWRRPEDMAERIARMRPLIEGHGTPAQRAALFGNLNRQLNQSNRFAPSDTALEYARAALEALPPPASPELRAPYQFALGFNLLWHGDLAEAEADTTGGARYDGADRRCVAAGASPGLSRRHPSPPGA